MRSSAPDQDLMSALLGSDDEPRVEELAVEAGVA